MKGCLGMNNENVKINIAANNKIGETTFSVNLNGETVKSANVAIGYSHRGLEHLAEHRTYLQYLPMTECIDYLSAFMYQQAFCSAIETIENIEIPEKAQYIRVLLMELNRIASILTWIGNYSSSFDFKNLLYHSLSLRNDIFDIFSQISGKRLMCNFFRFGGVKSDISNEILSHIQNVIKKVFIQIKEFDKVLSQNPVFCRMTQSCGILSKNIALNYSITGANLRASNIALDFRKQKPYLIYNKLDFDVVSLKNGDCYSRYLVRLQELSQSCNLILQCIDFLKNNSGEIKTNINIDDFHPNGLAVSYVESSRGIISCFVFADGTDKPFRVKWRTGSFYAAQLIPKLLSGCALSDIDTIIGSFDILSSEVDR
jgi:NADH-quinone oxidoreductase subunit D